MSSPTVLPRRQIHWLQVFAFVSVYFIWGSTYLAIRFVITTLPPWLMASGRFAAAGFVMLILAAFKRESPLSPQEKSYAWKTGPLLMLANATVCYVEKWIPSGVVAVIIGAMPIWVMLFGRFVFARARLSKQKYFGATLGLVGVACVAWNDQSAPIDGLAKYILIILIFSSWAWAFATQLQKNMGHAVVSPLRYAGVQMLTGSVVTLCVSLAFGEVNNFHFNDVTASSFFAWLYLVLFGSVIAFTAYSYLAQVVEPHMLSSYALVNPIIAVFLGSLIGHEALSPVFFSSTAIVLAGIVLLIFDFRKSSARRE